MRVLLLGSCKLLLKALKQGLEEDGFRVDIHLQTGAGHAVMPGGHYDVIVMDLARPQGKSLSLVQRWRQAGLTTPVLVLTVPDGPAGAEAPCPDEVDGWLTKPFELEEFLARLRNLVQRPPCDG